MDKILSKMIQSIEKTGLLVFDAPTGLGKTTAAVHYTSRFIKEKTGEHSRIIYITNLKNNLPIDSLKNELQNLYHENVLFLKPYYEEVIDSWQNASFEDALITNTIEYLNLKENIEEYLSVKDFKSENSEGYLLKNKYSQSLLNKISEISEPNFRKKVKEIYFLNKDFHYKKKVIKQNEWMKQLYPATIIDDFKVLIMSTDKFLHPIDPFYKSAFRLMNDKLTMDSLIFIDEFDSTKKKLLDHILEDGLSTNIDLINMFLNIHDKLNNLSFPEKLYKTPNLREDELNEDFNIVKHTISENRKLFNKTYDDFNMNYLFKTINLDTNRTFLFSDGYVNEIIRKTSKKKLYLLTDETEKINKVTDEQTQKKFQIEQVISEIRYAIDFFINGVSFIAENYQKFRNNNTGTNSDFFTLEDSYETILSVFNIEFEFKIFALKYLELINVYGIMPVNLEKDFYHSGLSFFELEDNTTHDLETIMRYFQFPTTPETQIINLSKKCKVVAMSATASINTVIGNYDFNYINKILKEKVYYVKEENLENMMLLFQENEKTHYERKSMINVQLIDDYETLDTKEIIKKILVELTGRSDIEYYKSILDDNNSTMFNKAKVTDFHLLNIVKLAKVYMLFSLDKEVKSHVCFLNSIPGNSKPFNKLILNEIIKETNAYHSLENVEIEYLMSKEFDENLLRLHEKLYENRKVMLVTTYQTIGTGKNIQYELKDFMMDSVVKINQKDFLTKDFEGIYLQTPTNLVQTLNNLDGEDKHKKLARFLFHQEYLYKNKSLEYYQFIRNIENGFRKVFYNDKYIRISNKNSDLQYNTSQIVIQAVGRICRSRIVNKKTNIYTDNEIIFRLQDVHDYLSNRLLNYEMRALLNHGHNKVLNSIEKFSNSNYKAANSIKELAFNLRNNDANIAKWSRLREFVLKTPTSANVPDDLKEYYYEFTDEISHYTFKFGPNKKIVRVMKNTIYDYHEVSADECQLSFFMEDIELRNLFISNKYATQFKKNRFIMLPATYAKIYKGALGEIIGKHILECSILGVSIEELPPKDYELFDYKYNNYFIDFKHWLHYDEDRDKYTKKVLSKLKKVNGKAALVINILKRGKYNITQSQDGKILKVPNIYDSESNEIHGEVFNF